MNPDPVPGDRQDVAELEAIVSSDLGDPVTYFRPLSDAEKAAFQEQLDDFKRAHLDAEANLWRYFAG